MNTPSQEAKEILQSFYEIVGFHPQAKECAKKHVEKLMRYLDKNRYYTQCSIDTKFYEDVLIELDVL